MLLTTKVKPSILATLRPLVTVTVCPDEVKFPVNEGEHWISVQLNTEQALYPGATRHYF